MSIVKSRKTTSAGARIENQAAWKAETEEARYIERLQNKLGAEKSAKIKRAKKARRKAQQAAAADLALNMPGTTRRV